MKVDFEVFGDQQLSRELVRWGDRADDLSPAFEAFADGVVAIERKQFGSQGRYASGGWARLQPTTLAAKAAAGLDPRILHATLRLRKSLTSKSHADHVRDIGRDEVFVGTSVPYARYHQQGRGVKRRRPVELTARDRRNAVKTIQLWLARGEVRQFLGG